MFKKDDKDKFVKVPQVEIDDRLYHESAEVAFGIVKETIESDIGGNKHVTRLYKLKKYVLVRGKVAEETVVRTEEGSGGRLIVKNQLDIEMKKEFKRMEEK